MIEGRDGGQNGSRSFFAPAQGKETTGRYLVLFREEAVPSGAELLRDAAGMNVATSGDFEAAAVAPDQISGADAVLFQGLGVAVVSSAPDQLQSLGDETEGAILAIEPERVMYALGSRPALALDEELASVSLSRLVRADAPTGGLLPFLQGYREGIETLVERLISLQGAGTVQEAEPLDVDESRTPGGFRPPG